MNSAELDEGIRLREQEGKSVRIICARLGGSNPGWCWRFLARDVERGGVPRHRPASKPFDETIVAMRREGATLTAIGETIGRTHTYVISRLLRIGRQQAWDDAQTDSQ